MHCILCILCIIHSMIYISLQFNYMHFHMYCIIITFIRTQANGTALMTRGYLYCILVYVGKLGHPRGKMPQPNVQQPKETLTIYR